MVEAIKFNIQKYLDMLIPSEKHEGLEYQQCYSITEADEQNGQTVAIILSRLQDVNHKEAKKLVALKFITTEYLKSNDRNEANLEHEISSLERCESESWCLNLVEVLRFEDCVIIVTDLIYGCDLFRLRREYKKNLKEIEGRNIIQSVTEAVVGLQ